MNNDFKTLPLMTQDNKIQCGIIHEYKDRFEITFYNSCNLKENDIVYIEEKQGDLIIHQSKPTEKTKS